MLRPTFVFAGVAVVFFALFAVAYEWAPAIWLWWIGVSNLLLAMMFGLFCLMERIAPMSPTKANVPPPDDSARTHGRSKPSTDLKTQKRKAA